MSDLRLYVEGKDGEEMSYVIHYGMGCRLVTAVSGGTDDFYSLLKGV